VAIKLLPDDLAGDPERLARFEREAKTVAALNHPNIVTIHSVERVEGIHFFTMELVEGRNLADVIPREGLPVERFLNLALPLAEAIAAAHERGVTHRDLKPRNIMVSDEGHLKVLDFGLAKLRERARAERPSEDSTKTETRDGLVLGTMPYMSPEQLQGKPVDHRADIFALGIVLYEMATGRRPFSGDNPAELASSILRDAPSLLTDVNREIPTDLARIVRHCLQKDPDRRYQTARGLSGELEELREDLRRGAAAVSDAVAVKTPSIAVLPFADMSPQRDQEYFCDGLAEELINALAHIKPLRVVARTSAFSFKGGYYDVREIGEKLNVDTVLEGSIRKAGDRLRITTQLVSAADGYHLWSEKYDRNLEDIFVIQDEISLAIVDKLKIELLGGEAARLVKRGTENLEAYDLCVRGRFFWEKRGAELKKAIEYFEQAIEKDPDYAEPHAGISDSYSLLSFYGYMPSREALPMARDSALRALEIDDTIAEAHSALGYIHQFYDWDSSSAEKEFRRAIELNSAYTPAHYWYSALLALAGRDEEALGENERAIETDPLSIHAHTQYGWNLLGMREFRRAEERLKRALDLNPDYALAHWLLGYVYGLTENYDEAIAELRKSVELSGNNSWMLSTLGNAYGRMGKMTEAREVLSELLERSEREYVQSFHFATVYLGLREFDEAFTWLERSYEDRDPYLIVPVMRWDPTFEGVLDDPRFIAVVEKVRGTSH
jgi:TolB-like protein/Tfp pilus assembly protein PilF